MWEVNFGKIVFFDFENKQTYPYFRAAPRESVDTFACLAISGLEPAPRDLQTGSPCHFDLACRPSGTYKQDRCVTLFWLVLDLN